MLVIVLELLRLVDLICLQDVAGIQVRYQSVHAISMLLLLMMEIVVVVTCIVQLLLEDSIPVS